MPNKPTLIIDNAEQAKYYFSDKVNTIVKSMDTGDYSIVGFDDLITIERKSLDDYVQSLFQLRFKNELERMKKFKYACVVVEAQFREIHDKKYTGEMPYWKIESKTFDIMLNDRIPIYFMGDRQQTIYFVEKLLLEFYYASIKKQASDEGNSYGVANRRGNPKTGQKGKGKDKESTKTTPKDIKNRNNSPWNSKKNLL